MTGFKSKRKSSKDRMDDMKQFDAYLGDGVYASFDGTHIWLNETVALAPHVFDNLVDYEKRLILSAMAVDGNA